MSKIDYTMPDVMRSLHRLDFDYADGDGIDFEPYPDLLSHVETREWLQAWTGNQGVDGSDFRVFGQDSTGGLAAFWVADETTGLLEQPIVFLGSEGETGVVASSFAEYLWLLAQNLGPLEVIEYGRNARGRNQMFAEFAQEHAPGAKANASAIVSAARDAHPSFGAFIESLCT